MEPISLDADSTRRADLADFLRTRRAQLQPQDVGLLTTKNGRRNTPGLRREEVAQISGVGLTWYTWLEQGRAIRTSNHVIDALARALLLNAESHRHLRQLANLPAPVSNQPPEDLPARLHRLLEQFMPAPASILDCCLDYIAWNPAHAQLWRLDKRPHPERNALWLTFMDPAWHEVIPNWKTVTGLLLAHFRSSAAQHPGHERIRNLTESLLESSDEFRSLWSDHSISDSMDGSLTLVHPRVGVLRLDVTQLHIAGHPPLTLSLQTPTDASDQDKLRVLLERRPT